MLKIRSIVVGAAMLFAARDVSAQGEALSGLLGNATDFNFGWTSVALSHKDLRAEDGSTANGFGFELSFNLPGGITRRRIVPTTPDRTVKGTDCESRFLRGELKQDEKCEDIEYKPVKRTIVGSQATVEQIAKVHEFNWNPNLVTFEAAVGFSQSGAFVARDGENEMRTSLREAPSVSIYANYEPTVSLLAGEYGVYGGARSGLISLNGARAYIDGESKILDGSTFQLGPVFGLVANYGGLNWFAEGAYLWRHIKSIEWDSDVAPGALPRKADLSGFSFSVGVQFHFRDADN